MSRIAYRSDRPWDKLVWGVILMALGMCFLLMMNGILPSDFLHAWWPLFVIAAGTGSLLCARDPRTLGSAVTTIGIGAWLLIAANDWYGLGWYRSWPLALVAAGLGTLVQALAQSVWPRREDDHVA